MIYAKYSKTQKGNIYISIETTTTIVANYESQLLFLLFEFSKNV